jgi:hypothetical protein
MNERTGRTTKMLEGALASVRKGKSVVVVAHRIGFLGYCKRVLERLGATRFEVERIAFAAPGASRAPLYGRSFDAVLVDHAVWEQKGETLLRACELVEAARARTRGASAPN